MKVINYKNILIFFWLCILTSINSHYSAAQNFQSFELLTQSNFLKFINLLRFYIPFLILPILIMIFLSNPIKKPNALIFLLIVYFCWQLLIFFISKRYEESLEIFSVLRDVGSVSYSEYDETKFNILNLIFNALSILFIFLVANNLNLREFEKKLFIVTLCFIGLIAIFFVFNLIGESIKYNLKFVYSSSILRPDGVILGQPSPRITGLSRMIIILYFLFFFFLLNNCKKIAFYIIPIILVLIIYKMQTRGAFIGFLIVYFIFFLFHPFDLKKKLFIFIILFLLPISLFEAYYHVKERILKLNLNPKINSTLKYNEIESSQYNRILGLRNDSSGRLSIWKKSLVIVKEKKILLGYGPQADRFLLFQYKIKNENNNYYKYNNEASIYDNNASNALMYAYLCGGIFGFFLLSAVFLLATFAIIKNIFYKEIFLYNKNSSNIWLNYSTTLLTYLIIRSFFENSFSVFGLDYIFFILAYLMSTNSSVLENKFSKR
jgi:hypothetical protein